MAWKLDPHNNLATLQNLVTRMPSAAFLHPQNAPKSLVAGAYSAPPNPLAGLRRPISKGRGRNGGTLDPHNVGDRLTPTSLGECSKTFYDTLTTTRRRVVHLMQRQQSHRYTSVHTSIVRTRHCAVTKRKGMVWYSRV